MNPRLSTTLQRPAIALLSERMVRLATGVVLTVLIARVLGSSGLGLFSIVMTWASFLVPISSMGLNQIVVRQVTQCAGDIEAVATLCTAVILRLVLGIIAALAMLLVFQQFEPLGSDQISLLAVATLFILQSLYSLILFEYFLNYQGFFYQVALVKVAVTLAAFVVRLGVLYLGFGVGSLLVVAGLEVALIGLLQYGQFRKLHHALAGGSAPAKLEYNLSKIAFITPSIRGSSTFSIP